MMTGCIGDKITFSEVAEAEGEENKEYFTVRHVYDFMLIIWQFLNGEKRK